jgi:hypothetical protein
MTMIQRTSLLLLVAFALWARVVHAQMTPPLARNTTNQAQVFVAQDAQATSAFKPDAQRVRNLVNMALTNLTGIGSVPAAWRSLAGTNETIGIKVYASAGANVGTRLDVVAAVVEGLISAGVPTNKVIVWDRYAAHLRHAGFYELQSRYGIRMEGAVEAGFDPKTSYDTALMGNLVYGDLEFGQKDDHAGRKSFISRLVATGMTKIINISPLLNHNSASITGNLYSLALGSADNIIRFESSPSRLATAVPELYALPILSDRVVLNITDALLAQYQGEDRGMLHYTVAMNEIRMSRDPVALDVLGAQDLEKLRRFRSEVELPVNWDLYKNAALLQLGVSDPKQINVTTLKVTAK